MIIPNIWENKKWQPNHQPDKKNKSGWGPLEVKNQKSNELIVAAPKNWTHRRCEKNSPRAQSKQVAAPLTST